VFLIPKSFLDEVTRIFDELFRAHYPPGHDPEIALMLEVGELGHELGRYKTKSGYLLV